MDEYLKYVQQIRNEKETRRKKMIDSMVQDIRKEMNKGNKEGAQHIFNRLCRLEDSTVDWMDRLLDELNAEEKE